MCAVSSNVREPVCAGTWYPGKAGELSSMLDEMLAEHRADDSDTVQAILAPHAGYVYSGPVAAAAYARLKESRGTVYLMGPSHYTRFSGVSILDVAAYRTPLGDVPLSPVAKDLRSSALAQEVPDAHAREHSLELQLPFLQHCLREFELVPILVGEIAVDYLAQLIGGYMNEDDLLVVSADLSHFYNEEQARVLDGGVLETIRRLDHKGILSEEIDAPWAVASLLRLATRRGWKPGLMKYATSADVSGDRQKVVGYASFIFS